METFRFEVSWSDWNKLRNCWKKIESKIESDSDLNDCKNVLNEKLFNKNNKSPVISTSDISVNTMNKLMNEIDNETIINEMKDNTSHSQTTIDTTNIPSNVIDFIKKPVKCIYSYYIIYIYVKLYVNE